MNEDLVELLSTKSPAELAEVGARLNTAMQSTQDSARRGEIREALQVVATVQASHRKQAKLRTEMAHQTTWPRMGELTGESQLRTNAREAGQGLFQLGDEATAALASPFAAMATGESIPEAYAGVRDMERAALTRGRQAMDTQAEMSGGRVPGASRAMVPQAAGIGLSGLGTARLAGAALSPEKFGPASRAILPGGAGGAVTGFGGAQGDAWNQFRETAIGGGLGLAGGSLLALLGAGGAASVEMIRRWTKPMRHPPDEQARKVILEQLEKAELTPEDIAQWMTERGPDVVPGMHPAFQGLVRGSLSGGAHGRELVTDLVENHVERQYTDLLTSVDRMFVNAGMPSEVASASYREVKEMVADTIRKRAGPKYDELYAQPDPQSGKLRDLLDNPKLKQAYADAIDVESINPAYGGNIRLVRNPEVPEGHAKQWIWESTPSWRELDLVQRGLRAKVEQAKRAAATGQGGSSPFESENWGKLRTALLDELDTISPEFGALRRQYASDISVRDHMEMGEKVFYRGGPNWGADDIKYEVARMNPDEVQGYRIGALKAIRESLAAKGDNANLQYASVFNTPDGRARLEAVFGESLLADVLKEVKRLGKNAGDARLINTVTSTSSTIQNGGNAPFGMNAASMMNNAIKDVSLRNDAKVLQALKAPMLSATDPASFLNLVNNPSVMGQSLGFVQRAFGMPTAGAPGLWGSVGGTGAAQMAAPLFQQPQE